MLDLDDRGLHEDPEVGMSSPERESEGIGCKSRRKIIGISRSSYPTQGAYKLYELKGVGKWLGKWLG